MHEEQEMEALDTAFIDARGILNRRHKSVSVQQRLLQKSPLINMHRNHPRVVLNRVLNDKDVRAQ